MQTHSSYLKSVFGMEAREETIKKICQALKKKDFDIIAVRGVSGLLVGMAVALKLKKGLVVIRKGGEGSHSSYNCEGNIPDLSSDRWIILDDFVASGATVAEIIKSLAHYQGKFVGFYGYYPDGTYVGWLSPFFLMCHIQNKIFCNSKVIAKLQGE